MESEGAWAIRLQGERGSGEQSERKRFVFDTQQFYPKPLSLSQYPSQLSIAAAIPARTASGSGGIAPACEATHAPQRLPASFNLGQAGSAQQRVRHRRGKRISRADGVGHLDREAGVQRATRPASPASCHGRRGSQPPSGAQARTPPEQAPPLDVKCSGTGADSA